VALSRPLVALGFQHGAFTAADPALVARVQACYLLQVPIFLVGILHVRVISSMNQNRFLLRINAVNVVANVVLDYVLLRVLGIAGIALATTLVYALSTALLVLVARRLLSRAGGQAGRGHGA
jgi:putative peptidoglycan lipid II flippase